MAKPVITTRAGKGSALTWTEGDTNLTNLRDATVTLKAGTGGTDVVSDLNGTTTIVGGTGVTVSGDNTAKTVTINASLALDDLTDVNVIGASNGQVLAYNNSLVRWEAVTISSGISSVVDDTTPQLGGNLNVAGNSIVSASNGNIAITPNGTGSIVLDGLNWPQADGTSNQVLKTDGLGQLSWTTISSGATALSGLSDVTITAAASGDILRYNAGVGKWVDTAESTLSVGSASSATVASTVTLTADNTTNATNYPLFANAATGNISPRTDTGFTYNPSTNVMTVGGTALPGSTGTTGQVLALSSAGTAAWTTASSGLPVTVVKGGITNQTFSGVQTGVAETTLPHTWAEASDTSGMVTVSTDTVTITSAGTYLLEYKNNYNPLWNTNTASATNPNLPEATFKLYNSTDATILATTLLGGSKIIASNGTAAQWRDAGVILSAVVTIASSKSFTIRYGITAGGSWSNGLTFQYTGSPNTPILKITKLA